MVSPRPAWPTPSSPTRQLLVLCTAASRRGTPVTSRHRTTMAKRSTGRTRVANPCSNPPSRTPNPVARSPQHTSHTPATRSWFGTPNPRSRTSHPRPARHGRIPRTCRSTSSSTLGSERGHLPVWLYTSNPRKHCFNISWEIDKHPQPPISQTDGGTTSAHQCASHNALTSVWTTTPLQPILPKTCRARTPMTVIQVTNPTTPLLPHHPPSSSSTSTNNSEAPPPQPGPPPLPETEPRPIEHPGQYREALASLDSIDLVATLQSKVCIFQSPPQFLKGRIRHALTVALEAILAANTPESSTRAWKLWSLLPRMIMHRPPGTRTLAKDIWRARITAFQAGQWLTLLSNANASYPIITAETSNTRPNPQAHRARQLVHQGELSAARQALSAGPLAPGRAKHIGRAHRPQPPATGTIPSTGPRIAPIRAPGTSRHARRSPPHQLAPSSESRSPRPIRTYSWNAQTRFRWWGSNANVRAHGTAAGICRPSTRHPPSDGARPPHRPPET